MLTDLPIALIVVKTESKHIAEIKYEFIITFAQVQLKFIYNNC